MLSDSELLTLECNAVAEAMTRANGWDGFASNLSRESIVAGLRAVANAAAKNALEDAADAWHEENTGTRPQVYSWLCAYAASIPTITKENERG